MASQPESTSPRGWHSRGYLPHFDGGSRFTQSVNFRLADSLPQHVVDKVLSELRSLPESQRDVEKRKRYEAFLDTGFGSCALRDERIALMVERSLLHFDDTRYRIHAWVIMPNHVHVLFTPIEPYSVSQIVGAWKSFTAKEANGILGSEGQFWAEDYFDRYIRDESHFHNASEYIEGNPVSAGLCKNVQDWKRSSAAPRQSTQEEADRSRRRAAETAAVPGKNAAETAAVPGKIANSVREVSASFKIGWRGCEFEAAVSVPSEPVSPRRLLPMVQKLTNALVGMGEQLVQEMGASISCKAGCGACCRQLVPVSETEARHLRDLVEAMPEPRRSQVKERFAETRRQLADAGMLDRLLKPNEHTRDINLGIEYFRAGVACPFLEDESCSIHPDRPLVCREYLVTSPAELCASPSAETIDRVPVPGFFMTAFARLDYPDKNAVRWVPLPMALEWADEHPEPPASVPGPKLFSTFMNGVLGSEKVPAPGQVFTPKPTDPS